MLFLTATSNIMHETENDKMLGSIEIWAQVTMKSIKLYVDVSKYSLQLGLNSARDWKWLCVARDWKWLCAARDWKSLKSSPDLQFHILNVFDAPTFAFFWKNCTLSCISSKNAVFDSNFQHYARDWKWQNARFYWNLSSSDHEIYQIICRCVQIFSSLGT